MQYTYFCIFSRVFRMFCNTIVIVMVGGASQLNGIVVVCYCPFGMPVSVHPARRPRSGSTRSKVLTQCLDNQSHQRDNRN